MFTWIHTNENMFGCSAVSSLREAYWLQLYQHSSRHRSPAGVKSILSNVQLHQHARMRNRVLCIVSILWGGHVGWRPRGGMKRRVSLHLQDTTGSKEKVNIRLFQPLCLITLQGPDLLSKGVPPAPALYVDHNQGGSECSITCIHKHLWDEESVWTCWWNLQVFNF